MNHGVLIYDQFCSQINQSDLIYACWIYSIVQDWSSEANQSLYIEINWHIN